MEPVSQKISVSNEFSNTIVLPQTLTELGRAELMRDMESDIVKQAKALCAAAKAGNYQPELHKLIWNVGRLQAIEYVQTLCGDFEGVMDALNR